MVRGGIVWAVLLFVFVHHLFPLGNLALKQSLLHWEIPYIFVNPISHPILSKMGRNIRVLQEITRHDELLRVRIPRSSFQLPSWAPSTSCTPITLSLFLFVISVMTDFTKTEGSGEDNAGVAVLKLYWWELQWWFRCGDLLPFLDIYDWSYWVLILAWFRKIIV